MKLEERRGRLEKKSWDTIRSCSCCDEPLRLIQSLTSYSKDFEGATNFFNVIMILFVRLRESSDRADLDFLLSRQEFASLMKMENNTSQHHHAIDFYTTLLRSSWSLDHYKKDNDGIVNVDENVTNKTRRLSIKAMDSSGWYHGLNWDMNPGPCTNKRHSLGL